MQNSDLLTPYSYLVLVIFEQQGKFETVTYKAHIKKFSVVHLQVCIVYVKAVGRNCSNNLITQRNFDR